MSAYRDIEGVVKRVDAGMIVFRVGCEDHDITIPRAVLQNPDAVHEHDNWISVSRRYLRKLEREE